MTRRDAHVHNSSMNDSCCPKESAHCRRRNPQILTSGQISKTHDKKTPLMCSVEMLMTSVGRHDRGLAGRCGVETVTHAWCCLALTLSAININSKCSTVLHTEKPARSVFQQAPFGQPASYPRYTGGHDILGEQCDTTSKTRNMSCRAL